MNKLKINAAQKIKLMEEAEAIINECEDIRKSIIGTVDSPEQDAIVKLIAMKMCIADMKMSVARNIE